MPHLHGLRGDLPGGRRTRAHHRADAPQAGRGRRDGSPAHQNPADHSQDRQFVPRNQKVTQTFAALLHEAGIDFGILYEAESNAGNDVRRVGEEGLYELLATANLTAMAGASFKTIVTTDPHSYNTIRNEYPDFGGQYDN